MVIVSVIVLVSYFGFALTFGVGFGAGLGADTVFGAGEQIDSTQRSAASADRGMLAIALALGQLACTGGAAGFGAGFEMTLALLFGGGLGFAGTLTVTVLVMVRVELDPGDPPVDPTQTVTDPDPILDPCETPELEDPPPEQPIAIWVSNPTSAVATRTLAKLKLPKRFFLMTRKVNGLRGLRRSFTQTKNPIQWMGFFKVVAGAGFEPTTSGL